MLLAIWDDGGWQTLAIIATVAVVAYLLVLWIAGLAWTYRDAGARTRDPVMQTIAVLLVLVFNLPGLIIYLILRPKDTLADQYDRQLEAEALLHELQEQATCPTCRRKIENDFAVCPFCRSTLREPCMSCSRPLNASWVACPFCGTDRAAPARATRDSTAKPSSALIDRPIPMPRRRASTATYTPAASPVAAPQPDAAPEPGS